MLLENFIERFAEVSDQCGRNAYSASSRLGQEIPFDKKKAGMIDMMQKPIFVGLPKNIQNALREYGDKCYENGKRALSSLGHYDPTLNTPSGWPKDLEIYVREFKNKHNLHDKELDSVVIPGALSEPSELYYSTDISIDKIGEYAQKTNEENERWGGFFGECKYHSQRYFTICHGARDAGFEFGKPKFEHQLHLFPFGLGARELIDQLPQNIFTFECGENGRPYLAINTSKDESQKVEFENGRNGSTEMGYFLACLQTFGARVLTMQVKRDGARNYTGNTSDYDELTYALSDNYNPKFTIDPTRDFDVIKHTILTKLPKEMLEGDGTKILRKFMDIYISSMVKLSISGISITLDDWIKTADANKYKQFMNRWESNRAEVIDELVQLLEQDAKWLKGATNSLIDSLDKSLNNTVESNKLGDVGLESLFTSTNVNQNGRIM